MWKILGIEQTRDIKAIKSAYARLIKEYNPEEYPEQFKLIYEAYKDACEYAKTGCIVIRSLGIAIRVRGDEPSDVPEKADETAAPSEEFDFGAVDLNADKAKEYGGETGEADEFDFGAVDLNARKDEKTDGAEISSDDPEDISDFDFGNINTEKIGCENELTYEERLHRTLMNMRRLIADRKRKDTPENWLEFFVYGDFEAFRDNREFRKMAAESIKYSQFAEEAALIIASAFGMGSYIVPANSRVEGKWSIVIKESEDSEIPAGNEYARRSFAEDFFSAFSAGGTVRSYIEKLHRKLFDGN